MEVNAEDSKKFALLQAKLKECGSIAVAVSGGLDSRFLVHAAILAGVPVTPMHIAAPQNPASERHFAISWLKKQGLTAKLLHIDPLSLPEVRFNHKDRCYFCKKMLFEALREAAGALRLCDGSNASDLQEYRPGLAALRELSVDSPLAEAGLDKAAIRRLAAATGLEHATQASAPCLLTRFPYNTELDYGKIRRLGQAEQALREFFKTQSMAGGKPAAPAGTLIKVKQCRLADAPASTPTFAGASSSFAVPAFRLRFVVPHSVVAYRQLLANRPVCKGRFELHLEKYFFSPTQRKACSTILASYGYYAVKILTMHRLSGFFDRK